LYGGLLVSQAKNLFASLFFLALSASALGFPAPKQENPFVGRWVVTFGNGVIETCEVKADKTAFEKEPHRSSNGTIEELGNSIVIRFADGRVERWALANGKMNVQHWCPATTYPEGAAVAHGVAERVR
jgi:hypothetical protein